VAAGPIISTMRQAVSSGPTPPVPRGAIVGLVVALLSAHLPAAG
jgi:hypothetical protein